MAFRSMRRIIVELGSIVVLVLASACGTIGQPDVLSAPGDDAQVPPSTVQPGPAIPQPATAGVANATPATGTNSSGRTTGPLNVTVTRGTITQTLSLDGLIVAQDQVPVTYSGRGVVDDVKVKVGQSVKEGDVLLSLDSTALTQSLDAARARYQTSQANLAQAQTQSAAHARSAQQQADTQQTLQQQAIADAQAGVRGAQDNLAKVAAGASDSDRRTAQNAVDVAQAALQKASDLQDQINAGPDQDTIRAAEHAVTNAQVGLAKAQADFAILTGGPDPSAVRAAHGDVDRARSQLVLAQTAIIDPKAPDPNAARIQHDQAIADAELTVQQSADRLTRLQQPPLGADVQAARLRVQDAQDAVNKAQANLDSLQSGPDQTSLDAAQAAVDTAQQNVLAARAGLRLIDSHPTPAELALAQDGVRRAQVALDNAQRSPSQSIDDADGTDLTALQQGVDQDQAEVASLEQAIQKTVLTSPVSGTVISVRAKLGAAINSAGPVFIIARPGAPVVHVDLADDEATQIAPGQQATIQEERADGSAAAALPAVVATVTPAPKNGQGSPSADFQVTWPADAASSFGHAVQVTVTVQDKEGVLLVPKKALRPTFNQTFVETVDGAFRHLVPVQVGIATEDKVEIVSGLTEGQTVLVARY
jgi:multidrug resistance efflux pump